MAVAKTPAIEPMTESFNQTALVESRTDFPANQKQQIERKMKTSGHHVKNRFFIPDETVV
jgi:hypothetical protein